MKAGNSATRKERTPQKNMKRNARITNRKNEHAKAMEENEEIFRRLADNAYDGILIAVGKGVHAYANKRAGEITGYSVAELLQTSIKDLVHPDESKNIMERFRKILSGEPVPPQYETVIINKDGKSVPIEVISAKTIWQGQPADMVIICDITERKKAEEALKKSEQRLRDAGEMAKVGGWELDLSTKEVLLSEEVCRIHGVEPGYKPTLEEALNFYAPESRPAVEAVVKKAAETGEPYDLESLFIPSGSKDKIWVRSLGRAVYSGGKIVKLVGTFQNINKYKSAEEALLLSEWELKKTQEFSHVGSWEWNAKTNEVKWSDEMFRIFGIEKEENNISLNTIIASAIYPEDKEKVDQANLSVIKYKKLIPIDYRVIWPDQSIHVVWSEAGELVLDEKGNPSLLRGYAQDITKRKKIEEALRESESSLQAILRSTADGILAVSRENKVLFANERFAEMWRIPWAVMASKDDSVLLQHVLDQLSDPQSFLEKVQELYKSKEENFDTLYFKDGRVFERLSRPLLHETELRGRVWSFRDITDRKKAEEELKASEEKYHSLFENVFDGVYQNTPDGRFLTVNPALVQMMGYDSKEELMNINVGELYLNPQDREVMKQKLESEGEVRNYELNLKRKDGQMITALQNAHVVYDKHGRVSYYEGTLTDVTEREKSEEALRKSEEHLREAQALGKIGNWEFDIASQKIEWSDEVYKLYERDRTLGPPSAEEEAFYYSPEETERLREFARLATERGEEFRYDLMARLSSGKTVFFNASMHPVKDERGRVIKLFGTVQDITKRKKAEEKIILNEARLQSLYHISQYKSENLQGLLNYALGEAIKLTRSKVGWFGFYQEENKILKISVWSAETMEECELAEKQYVFPLKNAGIWAEGIRQRKPFLVNDFQALDSTRKGYPLGHIELFKFLTIPLFSGDNIVAAIAVANKEQDYDESDILQLTLLMNSVMEITEHRKAEEALRISEERFRHISSTISDISYSCSTNQEGVYSIEWITGATEKITGYSMNEIKEKKCWGELVVEEDLPLFEKYVTSLAPGSSGSCELRLRHRDGHTVWVASFAECVREREPAGCLSLYGGLVDITERKHMEHELEKHRQNLEEIVRQRTSELEDARIAALNLMQDANIQQQMTEKTLLEKETLLQEVHHRVKNNLQVISSLIDMQRAGIKDPHIRQVLLDSQARIRAMAIIHEKLYQSRELGKINVEEYVRVLIDYLADIYRDQAKNIAIEIQVEELSMDIDTAIPCGLIINELASNAFKYAFTPEWNGNREVRLKIRKKEEGILSLEFSDNGGGIPDTLDIASVSTLGLRLVSMLVRQLKGTLELNRHGGTSFLIIFPYVRNEIER